MTPQDKADELIDKFTEKIYHLHQYPLCVEAAKECALVAVQELIEQCHSYREIDLGMSLDYWEEVKQEINKL